MQSTVRCGAARFRIIVQLTLTSSLPLAEIEMTAPAASSLCRRHTRMRKVNSSALNLKQEAVVGARVSKLSSSPCGGSIKPTTNHDTGVVVDVRHCLVRGRAPGCIIRRPANLLKNIRNSSESAIEQTAMSAYYTIQCMQCVCVSSGRDQQATGSVLRSPWHPRQPLPTLHLQCTGSTWAEGLCQTIASRNPAAHSAVRTNPSAGRVVWACSDAVLDCA